VYSLNTRDRNVSKSSGRRGASLLNGSNSSMKEADDHVHLNDDRREAALPAVQKARTEQLPAGYRQAVDALERYLMFFGPGTGAGVLAMLEDLADSSSRARRTGPRYARSSGMTPWSSPKLFFATIRRVSGSAGSGKG